MLLRLTLLSVLICACYAAPSMSDIAERMYKPCIVYKIGCPADGSMDLDKFAPTVRSMLLYKPPRACRCDLRRSKCVRKCYYAYIVKMYLASAVVGKTSASEIKSAKSAMLTYLRTYLRPCIVGRKDCGSSFSVDSMRDNVRNYLSSYNLPPVCECDTRREICIRECYYAYLKRVMETSATK